MFVFNVWTAPKQGIWQKISSHKSMDKYDKCTLDIDEQLSYNI